MTFGGGADESEQDEGDLDSEERFLRAERGKQLSQMRSGNDFASARVTLIDGKEGVSMPDIRGTSAAAVAQLRDSELFNAAYEQCASTASLPFVFPRIL